MLAHLVTMAYSGRGEFAASTSVPVPLTVARRGKITTLALAKTSVAYGHESAEMFTVSVSRAGRYKVAALYSGNGNYYRSDSRKKTLNVAA